MLKSVTLKIKRLIGSFGEKHYKDLVTYARDMGAGRDFVGRLECDTYNDSVILFVAYALDGAPVGAIAGRLSVDIYTGDYIMTQLFWYVVNEYRGTDAAIQLTQELEMYAKRDGCKAIVAGRFRNGDSRVDNILRYLDYEPYTVSYRKEL